MTQNEILKDFLSYLEDKYDVSVGSPFYDMLYPYRKMPRNVI